MPITSSNGVVTYTAGQNMDRAAATDVHDSASFAICDAKDPLKQVQFSCSSLTGGTPATLTFPASGTYTLPAAGYLSGQAKALQYAAPATGANVTIAAGIERLVLNPAADIAELTITLPVAPADGTEVRVSSTQAVTTLTIADGDASTVGGPSAMTDNTFFSLIYRATGTTWYRNG